MTKNDLKEIDLIFKDKCKDKIVKIVIGKEKNEEIIHIKNHMIIKNGNDCKERHINMDKTICLDD